MREADDIPELRDRDRYRGPIDWDAVEAHEEMRRIANSMPRNPDAQYFITEELLRKLEAARRRMCPNRTLHDILLYCPECGLGETEV